MPDAIDTAQVRQIAKLARLTLSDAEVQAFAEQLGAILGYFQSIDAIDTTDVEPLAHPLPVTDVLREDEPHTCDLADAALANAPQREGRFFKVPKVLDQGA